MLTTSIYASTEPGKETTSGGMTSSGDGCFLFRMSTEGINDRLKSAMVGVYYDMGCVYKICDDSIIVDGVDGMDDPGLKRVASVKKTESDVRSRVFVSHAVRIQVPSIIV